MKIVTFNLACDYGQFNGDIIENRWQYRKGLVLDKIQEEQPDLIGFQEATENMTAFLKRYLPEYLFVGCGRGGDFNGENNMIALRHDRYELMFLETFWLSETPNVPGSRYQNQSTCPRICTHVILRRYEDNQRFHFYNTHLDHISDEARVLGATAIMKHMAKDLSEFDLPVLLSGDMNAVPSSQPIATFLTDEKVALINQTPDCPESFHGFGKYPGREQIDYIFSKGFEAEKAPDVWHKSFGKYLSDHNALCAYLDIIKE